MSAQSTARHWSQISESTFVFGIRLLFWVHYQLGRWPFLLFLYPVVLVHWLIHSKVRRASLQYLQYLQSSTGALGVSPGIFHTLRHVFLFSETILDKLLAVSGRYPEERVTCVGSELVYQAALAGQGGILVTAHMGCLELCRALAETKKDFSLTVLVHTLNAEKFNTLLKRFAPDGRITLLEVSAITPATAILLSEKVQAGEYVAIAGDRVPVFAGQTVTVDFLGRPAAFPVGPYVLAGLLKCPLYFLACIHQGAGYCIYFEKITDRLDLPRGNRMLAITPYVQHYANTLSLLLKQSPYDWFNFFPFWEQGSANEKLH